MSTCPPTAGLPNRLFDAALASAHFSPLSAVPSAIFSVWHNISGGLVATLYQRFRNSPEDAQAQGAGAKA